MVKPIEGIDLRISPEDIKPSCDTLYQLYNMVAPFADPNSRKIDGKGPLLVTPGSTLDLNPRWSRRFPDGTAIDGVPDFENYKKFLDGKATYYLARLIFSGIGENIIVTYRSTFDRGPKPY